MKLWELLNVMDDNDNIEINCITGTLYYGLVSGAVNINRNLIVVVITARDINDFTAYVKKGGE